MSLHYKHIFKIKSTFIMLMMLVGCIHNYEPDIKSIAANPNPVQPGGVVTLTCSASDDDESSMLKNESLSYSWSAAYGQIISYNEDNNATWTAPDMMGEYSISCTVNDQFDGTDIFTIDITVQ